MSGEPVLIRKDQCGYCREEGNRRIDPRVLPCDHAFCLPCITSDFKRTNAVTCPVCRSGVELDISLANLPMLEESEEINATNCYSCKAQSGDLQPAVHFCIQCNKSYCQLHLNLHSQLHFDHVTKPLPEDGATPVSPFSCVEHNKYLYIVGCVSCCRLYCNMCLLTTPNYCFKAEQGTSHKFKSVEVVVATSKEKLNNVISTLTLRSAELDKLLRGADEASQVVNSCQESCEEKLERAFQDQVASLKSQYDQLKETVSQSKADVMSVLEEYVGKISAQQQAMYEMTSQLERCLQFDDVTDFMSQRDLLLGKAREISSSELPSLQDCDLTVSIVNVVKELNAASKLCNQPFSELVLEHGLDSIRITGSDAPTHLNGSPSQALPKTLSLEKTLLLYKNENKPPHVIFCTHKKAVYSLASGFLCRYWSTLSSAAKVGTHSDSGTFLQADADVLYTRQKPSSEYLVNVYPLQGEVVLPRLRSHSIHSDKQLLDRFAVVGTSVVFIETSAYPKLIVFADHEVQTARNLQVDFGVGVQQPMYITSGPPGHVIVVSKEWVEVQNKQEVLRLISIRNGKVLWKVTLDTPLNLDRLPDPVLYHNKYILLFPQLRLIQVLSVKSGAEVTRLTVPSIPMPGRVTPHEEQLQLCGYTDSQVLIPAHQFMRGTGSIPPTHSINLALFNVVI